MIKIGETKKLVNLTIYIGCQQKEKKKKRKEKKRRNLVCFDYFKRCHFSKSNLRFLMGFFFLFSKPKSVKVPMV